jgi:hypothetical protein
MTASVGGGAPVDASAPCATLSMSVWVGLRRLCLHRGFHARGTTSRLTRLLFAWYSLAKDLRQCDSSKISCFPHHHQSLVHYNLRFCS